jgi:hypothetical protein
MESMHLVRPHSGRRWRKILRLEASPLFLSPSSSQSRDELEDSAPDIQTPWKGQAPFPPSTTKRPRGLMRGKLSRVFLRKPQDLVQPNLETGLRPAL